MNEILIAGFGGQGVLFMGKLIAYSALISEKNVSWLPSYGPEMRGGTANCSVIVSDEQIGSPIVSEPTILIAMNRPSFEKYEKAVKPGGILVYDSTLIDVKPTRTDIKVFGIPATQIADEKGYQGLSNMLVVGKVIKESNLVPFDIISKAMEKVVPAKKAHLLTKNIEAVKLGYDY